MADDWTDRGGSVALPSEQSVFEQISNVIRSMDEIPAELSERLSGETDIVRDLRLDSIAVMDFVMAVETKFDVIIPIDTMATVRTIGDLAQLLETKSGQVRH